MRLEVRLGSDDKKPQRKVVEAGDMGWGTVLFGVLYRGTH